MGMDRGLERVPARLPIRVEIWGWGRDVGGDLLAKGAGFCFDADLLFLVLEGPALEIC
jgi:hypothetical protein